MTCPDWMEEAACDGREHMFIGDPKPTPDVLEAAAHICHGCPVITECADFLVTEKARGVPITWGMWAGIWRGTVSRRDAVRGSGKGRAAA